MDIEIAVVSLDDYKKFESAGMDAEVCLKDRVKLICRDDAGHVAESFMKWDELKRFGLSYIEQHAHLEYSQVCDEWFMRCSYAPWYNDLERNPEKIIPVEFLGIEDGTGREIYRGIETKLYYLRDVSSREPFAKWYVCGPRRIPEDGYEARPNLIFQHGEQQEKVVYDDWNGVAAYSSTFNRDFRQEV